MSETTQSEATDNRHAHTSECPEQCEKIEHASDEELTFCTYTDDKQMSDAINELFDRLQRARAEIQRLTQ